MSDLLNIPEGADFLRLSVHTVRLWVFQKRIPVVRLGRRVFLKREDLLAMIEQGRQPAVGVNGHK